MLASDIHMIKQWMLELERKNGKVISYRLVNRSPDRACRFYVVVPGDYGEPIIVQEPTYGLECPKVLYYMNKVGEVVTPAQKIVGVVCKDEPGKDGPRMSLTTAKEKGFKIELNEDGSIHVAGEELHINTLLNPDKNRMRGYVAFCSKVKKPAVLVRELGDLDLF